MSKEKNVEITIEYDIAHSSAFYSYEKFLKKNIAAGNKIPARVLKKFLAIIRVKKDREQEQVNIVVDNARTPVISRFSRDPDYQFTCKGNPEFDWPFDFNDNTGSPRKPKSKKVQYTFEGLMQRVFSGLRSRLLSFKNAENASEKEALIEYVYGEIVHYCSLPDRDPYTHYMKGVLTSYIVLQFNFYLSDKLRVAHAKGEEPTNHELFAAVKYYIKKIQKKGRDRDTDGIV